MTGINGSSNASARAWAVVSVLIMFMLINFADKAIIGFSAVPIIWRASDWVE